MNWKKLPKEKRDHLILVALSTAAVLGGLGFGLIRYQYRHLSELARQEGEARARLEQVKGTIAEKERTTAELTESAAALEALEAQMASGDHYSWALNLVRTFRVGQRVDVPGIAQPVVGDCTLLPDFPYRQASFSLSGSGYYHDIGRFLADFENAYPHVRLVNLGLSPGTSPHPEDREKLEFKVELVALLRPNQS